MPLNPVMLLILDYVRRELNSSERFRKEAADWSCRIVIKILPDTDIPYIYKLYMEVRDGECVELRTLEPEEELETDVVISMKLSTYTRLLKGEIGAIRAYISGAIKIHGPKASELRKRRGVLEELTAKTREILLRGKAIRAIFPLIKRDATF